VEPISISTTKSWTLILHRGARAKETCACACGTSMGSLSQS
jgi:hypothetical protein